MFALAYTPFIDPIDANRWWYLLLIPVSILISIAYKAVRVHDLRDYPKQVAAMSVQIIVVMALLAVASFLFVEKVLPMIGT